MIGQCSKHEKVKKSENHQKWTWPSLVLQWRYVSFVSAKADVLLTKVWIGGFAF